MHQYHPLIEYGLSDRFAQEAAFYEGLHLARVTEQHRDLYKVIGEQGELLAGVSGKLAYQANADADFPAVGDWVMIDKLEDSGGKAVIHYVLRRKSVFERKAAGTSQAVQIVAANIDVLFICMSLNADFNCGVWNGTVRRLEQYGPTGDRLTKADLCRTSVKD
jgi:ribosome biogenesis GTPase